MDCRRPVLSINEVSDMSSPTFLGNSPALRVFLFALGLLALSWPFGLDSSDKSLSMSFFYYLVCWGLLIVLLALMARSILRSEEREHLPPEE